jgi:hypothetical protein
MLLQPRRRARLRQRCVRRSARAGRHPGGVQVLQAGAHDRQLRRRGRAQNSRAAVSPPAHAAAARARDGCRSAAPAIARREARAVCTDTGATAERAAETHTAACTASPGRYPAGRSTAVRTVSCPACNVARSMARSPARRGRGVAAAGARSAAAVTARSVPKGSGGDCGAPQTRCYRSCTTQRRRAAARARCGARSAFRSQAAPREGHLAIENPAHDRRRAGITGACVQLAFPDTRTRLPMRAARVAAPQRHERDAR